MFASAAESMKVDCVVDDVIDTGEHHALALSDQLVDSGVLEVPNDSIFCFPIVLDLRDEAEAIEGDLIGVQCLT